MKAKTFWAVVLILGFLVAVSCNQDPIFYTIYTETPPLEPLISGSPTNMVVFNRVVAGKEVPVLCVASGSLYWYAEDNGKSKWNIKKYRIPQPRGKIIALAVAGDYLYALCLKDHSMSTDLKRIKNDGDKWEQIKSEAGGYPLIQAIHADSEPGSPGRLFAGARRNDSTKEVYAVLYLDESPDGPVLKILKTETSTLSGAAYREGNHYLITNGGGVFRVAETDLAERTVVPLSETGTGTLNNSRHFMGVIKLEDANKTIIAIERGHSAPERDRGSLYEISENSFERIKNPSNGNAIAAGSYATGALALWEGTDSSGSPIKLLVAGIQAGLINSTTSSYTYGYVEFDLNPLDDPDQGIVAGSLNTGSTPRGQRKEQGKLQSVSNSNRYAASIGKHSINHLFQAPDTVDELRTFFASTQIAGLWSYRERKDTNGKKIPQWNAEE